MNRHLMKQNFQRLILAVAACAVVQLTACGWQQPHADDAGDESFMRQVVPIIEGRKIRGYTEIKLLKDLAQATDRTTVIRALMQQPEYVSHWSEVLVDDLQVHREGARAQTQCYGTPKRATTDADLADALINAPYTPAISPAFNMSDVLRSTLVLDDLFPLYQAHLFAMENKPGFDPESGKRNALGTTFGHVYLNREMLCLGCHNSEFSMSGESTGWDRTYPIHGYFERALYGDAVGTPADNAFAVFRTDAIGGIAPWGISDCGTFDQTLNPDPLGKSALFAGLTGTQVGIFDVKNIFNTGFAGLELDGLQRTLPQEIIDDCNYCATNCNGSTPDLEAIANNAMFASDVKALFTTADLDPANPPSPHCTDCHSSNSASAGLFFTGGSDWASELLGVASTQKPSMKRVDPGHSNNSYLVNKLEGTNMAMSTVKMPYNLPALTAPQIQKVKDWIDSMSPNSCAQCPSLNCSQPKNQVAHDEAFAFMTAENIVDNVWQEAMGSRLTIGNYFPRNSSQHQALRDLTEYHFVNEHWSVQAVLSRALTSQFFNRKSPQLATTTSPYVEPPALDPWIVFDPREPPVNDPSYVPADHPQNHLNAMSEGIYRYSARSLLNSIHESLGWPAPQRFPPSGNVYANKDLQRAIGQYFSDTSPGFRGTDLQGLLFWENVHGACAKPAGVATDWIDHVEDAIAAANPMDPNGPLTVNDVAVVLRDWLLGIGTVSSTSAVGLPGSEADALASYFGVPSLTSPITDVLDLDNKLRGYCGVLVESPQFMLAGVAPEGMGPEPRFRVCNGGACTYQEMCNEIAGGIDSQLENQWLLCGADSVNIVERIEPPDVIWIDWCFGPGCGLLVNYVPEGCYSELVRPPRSGTTCTVEPPSCDVQYAQIGSCGGAAPASLRARGQRPLTLVSADGVQVTSASGVQIRPMGSTRFIALNRGDTLHYGDLLALPVGATLSFSGADARVETPRGGVPREAPHGVLFMMITGERAAAQQIVEEGLEHLPLDHIRRVRASWASHGEAGIPLSDSEFQSYQYPAEELPPRR